MMLVKFIDGTEREVENLSGANLSCANLYGANLSCVNLYCANLSCANLSRANLSRADLSCAHLSYANLSDADLSGANLSRANLSGANLYRANLSRANLSRAKLPTGEIWERYLTEVVPALLTAGGKTLQEIISTGCWNCHEWDNCPMHEAFGINSIEDAPLLLRPRITQFVALFDWGLIPQPKI